MLLRGVPLRRISLSWVGGLLLRVFLRGVTWLLRRVSLLRWIISLRRYITLSLEPKGKEVGSVIFRNVEQVYTNYSVADFTYTFVQVNCMSVDNSIIEYSEITHTYIH